MEGGRSFDRIQSNAGNIGFSASVDTGMDGIKVNLQCEQFTYYNHFAGGTGWCNRNSKIGLSHPMAGEIMFATWLLPYNEGVAQWVDPFYDAGADSHTSIMGSVGANTIFYNTGDFDQQASASGPGTGFGGAEFNYAGAGYDTGFNRRQENIIQYWSPNWNGFVFRFAWTVGNRDETAAPNGGGEIDPIIRSSSLAYTNGPVWAAVTWQDHEDWSAVSVGEMGSSDAESIRIAGRYIMDMGDGLSVQISAMYEDLEYEFNNVTSVTKAMGAFGFGGFASTGNMAGPTDDEVKDQKTYALINDVFGGDCFDAELGGNCPSQLDGGAHGYMAAVEDNPSTAADESDDGNAGYNVQNSEMLMDAVMDLDGARANDGDAQASYDALVDAAKANARAAQGAGGSVTVEREAWMVSGKVKFGGPIDFRFSYMDADDLEVSCSACSGDWAETAANAWNIGAFYTMPAGTELRLTYSEVDNDDNGTYGQGISGTGLGSAGGEIEMFAVGIVHWFD